MVVLLLFIVNWKVIRNTVKDTGFIDRVTRHTAETLPGDADSSADLFPVEDSDSSADKTPDTRSIFPVPENGMPPAPPVPSVPDAIPTPSADVPLSDAGTASRQSTNAEPPAPASRPAAIPAPAAEPVRAPESTRRPAEPPKPAAKPAADKPAPVPKTTNRPIYFIKFDEENGVLLRTRVSRTLPVTDSPLLDALNALLRGTTAAEERQELRTLIPAGTRVLSAAVRGSTAYVSFSEDFQFNVNGIEGYIAQLQQLVWTITEFPNVKDVQFLIEGRRVDYLGEGIQIGSPLGRGNFR